MKVCSNQFLLFIEDNHFGVRNAGQINKELAWGRGWKTKEDG